MDITATFSFRAEGEGTALESDVDARPKGTMNLLFPLMTPVIRRDFRKQVGRFKAFCERAAAQRT